MEKNIGNFQPNMKCPKCGKRKVYIKEVDNEFILYCIACNHSWDS